MTTAEAFLEALNLPTQHPYIPGSGADSVDSVKDWSMTNYFLSWKDSRSTSIESEGPRISNDCCTSDFTMPSWAAKRTSNNECNSKDGVAKAAAVAGSNSTDVRFLEEISPCIVSMLHMNILLWAPLIMLICLRRLTRPLQEKQRRKIHADRLDSGAVDDNKQTTVSKSSTCLIINYLPVMTNATRNQTAQKRQSRSPEDGHNDTLLFFSIPTKVFSRAVSQDEAAMGSPTGGYFTYIVALFFSAFIMVDPMYVFEFSRATLITIHLLFISLGMKRFGAKVSLYTALPVSTFAFYILVHQELNLPTFDPGLYYDHSNTLVTTAVSEWPVDKRTYDDGRGTPWMITGDTRTGLPFMFYKIPEVDFQRR